MSVASEIGSGGSGFRKILTVDTLNPHIKAVEHVVRKATWNPSDTVFGNNLRQASNCVNGKHVIRADVADHQAFGHQPMTYLRQVLALCTYPALFASPDFPDDVKQRAKKMLEGCSGGSIGSYTETAGIEVVRKDIATYVTKRDGINCDYNDILVSAGATEGIRSVFKLFLTGKENQRAGVMIPVPQYPAYTSSLIEYGAHPIPYYLDDQNEWSIDVNELQRSVDEARSHCIPKAIVVVNPNNPTGHVMSRQNIEEVLKFAKKERLFILADEVYQQNVFTDENKFHSFKKVLSELGEGFADMELASFMSTSKGYARECGFRGGYAEALNIDPYVKTEWLKSKSSQTCPTATGQIAMAVSVNPPQEGEPSYELFEQEKSCLLGELAQKAKLITEALNQIDGIQCNPVTGAIYAFPRIHLPQKAVLEAKAKSLEPDAMYCSQLFEETGVCVVPGCCFGQKPNTYHFRMTILPSLQELNQLINLLKDFHLNFTAKYS